MFVRRLVSGSATALLVALALVPATSASAVSCETTKSLTGAKLTTEILSSGVELRKYNFDAGKANSSPYEGRLTVAKGSSAELTLIPTISKIGDSSSQRWLAGHVVAQAHVNGNYYDFNSFLPEGNLGQNGSFLYGMPGTQSVIGIESQDATLATGVRDAFTIRAGYARLEATGYNLRSISSSDLVIYDSSYQLSKLPPNVYAVSVVRSKVSTRYKTGTRTVPKSGYVILAGSSRAASLKSLSTGSTVSFRTPAGTLAKPKYDSITPAVSVKRGSLTVNLDAVNYGITSNISAALFDDNWLGNTPNSRLTVLVNQDNIVTAVKTTRYTSVPDVGERVLKFYTAGAAAQAATLLVGDSVTIRKGWTSNSGSTYSSILSYHTRLLKNGAVVVTCTGASEGVRPRTAIGWDNKGNVYLATTTMGRAWPDGGYRLGGSTLTQLAKWLKTIGATDAASVDGGGSTTMYIRRGSEYTREDLPESDWVRSIAQGIALVRR
jgi:hypothetical protein